MLILGGSSVCVLDYYPLDSASHAHSIYEDAAAMHSKWNQLFSLPEKASLPKSFSSAAVFTRLSTDEQLDKVQEMLVDYATLYEQHLLREELNKEASHAVLETSRESLLKFLKMRIQTDSIKKILLPADDNKEDASAASWTKDFLEQRLYPLSLVH